MDVMLYSAAAYDIMSTGPKGKQLPFCPFFEEMEHYFWDFTTWRFSQLLEFLPPSKHLNVTRFATCLNFPSAKVSTDMLRTLPAFFGILMARPHERRSMVRVHGEDSGNRSKWITMYTPGKLTWRPKMMRPWKRSLRLWRWPFLVSMLKFLGGTSFYADSHQRWNTPNLWEHMYDIHDISMTALDPGWFWVESPQDVSWL